MRKQPAQFLRHLRERRGSCEGARSEWEQLTVGEIITQVAHDYGQVFEGDAGRSLTVTFTPAKPLQAFVPKPAALIGYAQNNPAVSVAIGDLERRKGVYVSGQSGTGKTTLLELMIKHDLEQGHGVFFLDPHGDAIKNVLRFAEMARLQKDVLLLDPEDKTHSFAINPLACKDVNDWGERNDGTIRHGTFFANFLKRRTRRARSPGLRRSSRTRSGCLLRTRTIPCRIFQKFLTNATFGSTYWETSSITGEQKIGGLAIFTKRKRKRQSRG